MVSRRSFLWGSGAVALAPLLGGCQARPGALQVRALNQSIPPQVIREFRQAIAQDAIALQPEATLADLLALLQRWQTETEPVSDRWDWLPFVNRGTPAIAELVTLGDAWLATAIRAGLIQPLDLTTVPSWAQLPPRWQGLVRRDREGFVSQDSAAPLWGAPYRWGTTMIVYHHDVFKHQGLAPPTDWADLWRPELRDRISAIDQPREIIGLTLKKLGASYNTWNLTPLLPSLAAELNSLAPQIRYYSNNKYLHPLAIKETWLAVGWSTDIIPALTNYPQLRAIIPTSGTALWSDLWVQPATATPTALSQRWLDFCWQMRSAQNISLFTDGLSPILSTLPLDQWPKDLQNASPFIPNAELFNRSEFLQPLPISTQLQYDTLWRKLRSPSPSST
ncbi:substrate-binding domain-containing protein [Spirulina major]|uniref:substrate-binding domain-containing protein n=1 Tax=Spirulina major TaxID=270636 RepID=UPI000934C74D|nr:substrate-binding domain-containing protein [Spirulina major]